MAVFNPNGYNRAQIAEALEGGLNASTGISSLNNTVQGIQTSLAAAVSDIYNLQQEDATINNKIQKLNTEFSRVHEIMEQITYKGSSNIIQLDPENMTTSSEATFSATLVNGVINFEKPQATATNPWIEITGVELANEQTYHFILGHQLTTTDAVIVYYLYDEDDSVICVFDNLTNAGPANAFTLDVSGSPKPETVTCKIRIEIDKNFSIGTCDVTPCISKSTVLTEDALPYFPSLVSLES